MPRTSPHTDFGPLPQEGFIRLPHVLHILGVPKSSFWRGVKEGRYPPPVKFGPRTTLWRVNDIRAFIASFDEDNSAPTTRG